MHITITPIFDVGLYGTDISAVVLQQLICQTVKLNLNGQVESKFQPSTSCNKQRTFVTLLEEVHILLTKSQLPQVKAKKALAFFLKVDFFKKEEKTPVFKAF